MIWNKLLELDIFDDKVKIPLNNATPAQVLEHILLQKWHRYIIIMNIFYE